MNIKLPVAIFIAVFCSIIGWTTLFIICADDEPKVENYNDDSPSHRDVAMYALQDYVITHLKNPRSYEKVSYESYYLPNRKAYSVTITYRATNSFNAVVTERITSVVHIYPDGSTSLSEIIKLQ